MGYTHYWRGRVDSTPELLDQINAVIAKAGVPLAAWDGEPGTEPVLTSEELRFNGQGPDDDHETFVIEFGKTIDFAFCKTARKPYDEVVVAILILLAQASGGKFSWSSDGDSEDHADGMALAVMVGANHSEYGYSSNMFEDDEW